MSPPLLSLSLSSLSLSLSPILSQLTEEFEVDDDQNDDNDDNENDDYQSTNDPTSNGSRVA